MCLALILSPFPSREVSTGLLPAPPVWRALIRGSVVHWYEFQSFKYIPHPALYVHKNPLFLMLKHNLPPQHPALSPSFFICTFLTLRLGPTLLRFQVLKGLIRAWQPPYWNKAPTRPSASTSWLHWGTGTKVRYHTFHQFLITWPTTAAQESFLFFVWRWWPQQNH